MNYILTREQMRELDIRTMKDLDIPSALLMECAGARVTDLILEHYSAALHGHILVLCGYGNNGGDGMVIARHLRTLSHQVSILMPLQGKMSPETTANLKRCEQLRIPILTLEELSEDVLGHTTLIIDALYGIGFRGELPQNLICLFDSIALHQAHREAQGSPRITAIAIDIPSGLDANNGNGSALVCDATIAIEEFKYGHFLRSGSKYCGVLHLVKIGIPEEYKQNISSSMLCKSDIHLPIRAQDAHKGKFGRVFLIGGSPDYPGSILLSARAALNSGAGLIYLYSRRQNLYYYASNPEIMSRAIPDKASGIPDEDILKEVLKSASAIVIGPGMGLDAYALKLLQSVIETSRVPTVIDADAITLLAQNPQLLPLLGENFILTPHKAEFCRLLGIELSTLDQDLLAQISTYHQKFPSLLLLKDHRSIFSDGKVLRILVSGNDALATGGSGDVLSGIIASLAAQGLPLPDAASSASLLMGKTAERLCRKRHSYSVRPSDIIKHLGDKDE